MVRALTALTGHRARVAAAGKRSRVSTASRARVSKAALSVTSPPVRRRAMRCCMGRRSVAVGRFDGCERNGAALPAARAAAGRAEAAAITQPAPRHRFASLRAERHRHWARAA
jgi:hypothetical protein